MAIRGALPPPGKERLAEIARRHRAQQAELRAKYGDPEEVLDRFAEQVFGSEAAQQVLIAYLREHTSWLKAVESAEDETRSPNGR